MRIRQRHSGGEGAVWGPALFAGRDVERWLTYLHVHLVTVLRAPAVRGVHEVTPDVPAVLCHGAAGNLRGRS